MQIGIRVVEDGEPRLSAGTEAGKSNRIADELEKLKYSVEAWDVNDSLRMKLILTIYAQPRLSSPIRSQKKKKI